jgi:hypothetical protein
MPVSQSFAPHLPPLRRFARALCGSQESGRSCRTGHRSDNRLLPSLSRVTPPAVSERFSELIDCPISRSLATSCVCLELRPLPSLALPSFVGITSLSATPKRPAYPSRASGCPSLATFWGFPCCARFAASGLIPRTSKSRSLRSRARTCTRQMTRAHRASYRCRTPGSI